MANVKRAWRVLRTAPIWVSFLLSSAHVLADPPASNRGPATKTAADSGAQPDPASPIAPSRAGSEQAAAVAYERALASYSKGDVAAALDSMRQSYQLSKRAELLYNLAQLEEELKACGDARDDYRRYLELVPHGRYREAAERAKERLELECPSSSTVTGPVAIAMPQPATTDDKPKEPPTEPVRASYWTTPRVIGWSAIAAGTLAGAGALYFELAAIQAKQEYKQSVEAEENGGPTSDSTLQDRQHRNEDLALALGITGGALVAGGALVLLLDPGKREPGKRERSASASVYALPGLVGACYAQQF
ncbi:MAG TPA: hypothetical protein VJV79_25490 [Polyangiaceae bacterium]|nr:hypothetical protein [Polyangiaceae bacterium]